MLDDLVTGPGRDASNNSEDHPATGNTSNRGNRRVWAKHIHPFTSIVLGNAARYG